MIARVLERREWGLIPPDHAPVLSAKLPAENSRVVVVEHEGQIVGGLSRIMIPHLEGLWISKAHRGNPVLAMALVEAAFAEVRKTGADWAWGASITPEVSDIIARVGGKELPVKSFIIPVGGSPDA